MLAAFEKYLGHWLSLGFLVFIAAFFSGIERDQVKQIGTLAISLPVVGLLLTSFRQQKDFVLAKEFLLLLGFFLLLSLADWINLGAINWKITKYYLLNLTFIIGAGIFFRQLGVWQRYFWLIPIVAAVHALITMKMSFFDEGKGYLLDEVANQNRLAGFGALYSPNSSAFLYSAVVIFGFFYLLSTIKNIKKSPYLQMLVLALIICFSFVVGTGTRTALLSIAVAAATIIFLIWRQRAIVIILPGLIFFLFIMLLGGNMNRGSSYRPEIWMIALDYISASPLAGYGYIDNLYQLKGGFIYNQPHNEFLRLAEIGGIPALLLFATTAFLVMASALRRIRCCSWVELAATACVLFSLVAMLFTANKIIGKYNEAYIYFWLPLGFLLQAEIQRRTIECEQKK